MSEQTTQPQAPGSVPKPSVDPMQTPEIGKLAEALAKAQGEMTAAKADTENTFFKSCYADLASVWDACRGPLARNGLAVIQTTSEVQGSVIIITTLAHSSGEWIRGRLTLRPVKADPQGVGSAITYGRRYALAAMVGIAQEEDDDGNDASGKGPQANPPTAAGARGQKTPSRGQPPKPSSQPQTSKPKVAPKGATVSRSQAAEPPSSASAEDDVPQSWEPGPDPVLGTGDPAALAPEDDRMDQAGESGIPMPSRAELDKKLMELWRPYLKKFPKIKPVDVLLERYQVNEVRQLTDEQVVDLIEFFNHMINR